ncbi:unnamed protein product [Symbiodinium natans]|uniref:PPM-type phosphatase domain-containing protein n=1 Tax=Symbiodinium natans TaxID=878477 RepID=A0A812SPI2_9DINO|nr:unnamed protein product [Symbiodinium natans]
MTEGPFQWEEAPTATGGGGRGQGIRQAANLAEAARLAEEAAAEARRKREAAAEATAVAKKRAEPKAAAFAGSAEVFEFAAESSFMQGRDELHLDRHVMVKDLAAAAKAMKMPIDALDKPVALFAVYDGHFGPKCAEFCAQNFHKKLLPRLAKISSLRDQTVEEQVRASLIAAIADLDNEFLSKFRTDRSGSCLQLALLSGRRLFSCGLGVGNTLLCSGEEPFEALHQSLSPDTPSEAQRVEAAGGGIMEVAPDVLHVVGADFEKRLKEFRIQSASGLGCSLVPPMTSPFPRALGDRELKSPNKVVLAEPEVRTVWLDRSHVALALYCDGISEHLPPEELAALLRRCRGSERRAAAEITQEAFNRGSEQNLTAITVYFRWPAKRSHDQVSPPVAAPAAKRPVNQAAETPKPAEEAPKSAPPATPPAVKRPVLTAEDVRREKASRKMHRHEPGPSPTPSVAAGLIEEQERVDKAAHALKVLRISGDIYQDDEGDIAHEFLEEAEGGLVVIQAVVKV